MKRFAIILLSICAVSDVLAVDDIQRSTYEWMKETLYNMVCRFDPEMKPGSQQKVTTVCDNKWIRFEQSCYLFSTEKQLDFEQAKNFCEQFDAHLVSIQSEGENNFLKEYVAKLKDTLGFWIGLTDQMEEGVWKWTDTNNEAHFTDWNSNEPGGERSQNCCVLWNSYIYKWADVSCTEGGRLFIAICEK